MREPQNSPPPADSRPAWDTVGMCGPRRAAKNRIRGGTWGRSPRRRSARSRGGLHRHGRRRRRDDHRQADVREVHAQEGQPGTVPARARHRNSATRRPSTYVEKTDVARPSAHLQGKRQAAVVTGAFTKKQARSRSPPRDGRCLSRRSRGLGGRVRPSKARPLRPRLVRSRCPFVRCSFARAQRSATCP